MEAKEKWVKIGRGNPRKLTPFIRKPWYSGQLTAKQTYELLQKLHKAGYKEVTWVLQPNKFYKNPGQPMYHLSLGYTGMSEE